MSTPIRPIKEPVKPTAQALSELVNKLEAVRTHDLHFGFIYYNELTKKAGIRYCTNHTEETKKLIDAMRRCADQIEFELANPKPDVPPMGIITKN